MIDIHSHIIPHIDDGAKNIETAISMLKKAEETGTKKIILTPHYFGKFTKSITEIKQLTQELKELAEKEKINIELYHGQEIFHTSSFLENLKSGVIGTLNDSRYILIEFDLDIFDKRTILSDLYELKLKGIIPIIAHPERYTQFIERPEIINEFIDEGALFQLDACSLSGSFGKDTKRIAEKFLRKNIYSFIGSDAHNQKTRTTDLKKYKEEIMKVNSKFIDKSIENAQKILDNNKVIFAGEKIDEKGNFFFSLFIN